MGLQRSGSRRSVDAKIDADPTAASSEDDNSESICVKTPTSQKKRTLAGAFTRICSLRKLGLCDSRSPAKQREYSMTTNHNRDDEKTKIMQDPTPSPTAKAEDPSLNDSMDKLISNFFDIVESDYNDSPKALTNSKSGNMKVDKSPTRTPKSPLNDNRSRLSTNMTPRKQHILRRLNSCSKLMLDDLNGSRTFTTEDHLEKSHRGSTVDSVPLGGKLQSSSGNSKADIHVPAQPRKLVAVRIRPQEKNPANGDMIEDPRKSGQRMRALVKAYSARELFARKSRLQSDGDTEKVHPYAEEHTDLSCQSERLPPQPVKATQSNQLGSKSERRSESRTRKVATPDAPDAKQKPRSRTPNRYSMDPTNPSGVEEERPQVTNRLPKDTDLDRQRAAKSPLKAKQSGQLGSKSERRSDSRTRKVPIQDGSVAKQKQGSRTPKRHSMGSANPNVVGENQATHSVPKRADLARSQSPGKMKQSSQMASKSERGSGSRPARVPVQNGPDAKPKPRSKAPKRHSMGSFIIHPAGEGKKQETDHSPKQTAETSRKGVGRTRNRRSSDADLYEDEIPAPPPTLGRQRSIDRLLDNFYDIMGDE